MSGEKNLNKVPQDDHFVVELIAGRSGFFGSIARKIQNKVRQRSVDRANAEAKEIHVRILGKK